jgi:FKBP-type peptidyl-prolyl cis-trans isomerase
MKMNRWFVMYAVILVFISSCTLNNEFKVSKSGMAYKIISGGGKDSLLKHGDVIRFRMIEKIEDSLLTVIGETPDQFAQVDSAGREFDVSEILNKLKVGDSAICRFPTDTIFAKNPGPDMNRFPKWLKPGKSVYVYIKILKKYAKPEDSNTDYQEEMMRMQKVFFRKDSVSSAKSNADFEKIAKEKFASASKTPGGTLVQIVKEGTGPACDSGKVVSMKYEGRFTDGNIFDGNMNTKDSIKARPLVFRLGVDPIIRGWQEGIRLMKKGTVAKIFVPYTQGYGPQQYRDIPGYSNLIFDVEVVDVMDAPKMPAASQAPQIR